MIFFKLSNVYDDKSDKNLDLEIIF